VLVQPSVYGTDNACLLQALRELGPGRARGVAVVDLDRVRGSRLLALHEAGVRGLRLNLEVRGEADAASARKRIAQAKCVADLPGWSLQVYARAELLVRLDAELAGFPCPVVLDHFAGLCDPEAEPASVERLLALAREPGMFVKASAPYKIAARGGPGFAAAARLAHRFHAAAPTRVLWGSDWPHTAGAARASNPAAIEPFQDIDDAAALAQITAALPDEAARAQLLVRNPEPLYGFEPVPA
jgi:predicted TIM-barrel fold metal-dependent hydrolase